MSIESAALNARHGLEATITSPAVINVALLAAEVFVLIYLGRKALQGIGVLGK